MSKFIDLTGQTFGKLKVLSRVENSKTKQSRWLCKCACGAVLNRDENAAINILNEGLRQIG